MSKRFDKFFNDLTETIKKTSRDKEGLDKLKSNLTDKLKEYEDKIEKNEKIKDIYKETKE